MMPHHWFDRYFPRRCRVGDALVSVGNPSAKDLDIDMIFGVNALHFLIATSSVLYALENAWPFIDCFTAFLTVRNHRSRIRSSNEGRQFRSHPYSSISGVILKMWRNFIKVELDVLGSLGCMLGTLLFFQYWFITDAGMSVCYTACGIEVMNDVSCYTN